MGKTITIEKPIIYLNSKTLPEGIDLVDAFSPSLEELFYVRNPKYKKGQVGVELQLEDFKQKSKVNSVWVFYPKHKKAICIPEENVYLELRTARNKNLITPAVQKKYREMVIGIIGLSIGSAVVNYMSYTGGAKRMKLADFDNIEITNLNRMHANLIEYGQNKTKVAAERIWEIDPFADLTLYTEGINEKTLEAFILSEPRLSVFIDAMDSLPLKVKARVICRNNKIPVVMATSNGDSIIIDIERFDLDQKPSLFHNRLGDIKESDLEYMGYKEWLKLATNIVGEDTLTVEMKKSLKEIGKTIASVPQLSTTVNLGGIALAYVLRKISENPKNIPSARYLIQLEDIFKLD